MRKWEVVLDDKEHFADVRRTNLVDIYFHFKHGIVDDITQLCDEEDIKYFQQLIANTDKFRNLILRSDDGIDIALARSGSLLKANTFKTSASPEFDARIHGYFPTVATLWKYFATGIIDAPVRYGEGTKAFDNFRTMLATGQKFMLLEEGYDRHAYIRYKWSITPKRLSIIESETLYKIKDLRYWLNYIGLLRFEELDEPITQITEETLTQLLPYIYRFAKEEKTAVEMSKRLKGGKANDNKNNALLSFDGKLFAIKNGELAVMETAVLPHTALKRELIKTQFRVPALSHYQHTSPVVQSLTLKTLEHIQPKLEPSPLLHSVNFTPQYFEANTTMQDGVIFPMTIVNGATDWEKEPTTRPPLLDFAYQTIANEFEDFSIKKIEYLGSEFFVLSCLPKGKNLQKIVFINVSKEEEIKQHLVSIILNQLFITGYTHFNTYSIQSSLQEMAVCYETGTRTTPLRVTVRR